MKVNRVLRAHNLLGFIYVLCFLPFVVTGTILLIPEITGNIVIKEQKLNGNTSISHWKNIPFKTFKYDGERAYIYGKMGIYYSNDSLKSIVEYNEGLPIKPYERQINSVCEDSLGTFWAATNKGVYFRSLNTQKWIKYNQIPDEKVVFISDYKGYAMVFFLSNRIVISDIETVTEHCPTTSSNSQKLSTLNLLREIHSFSFANSLVKYMVFAFFVGAIFTLIIYVALLCRKIALSSKVKFITPVWLSKYLHSLVTVSSILVLTITAISGLYLSFLSHRTQRPTFTYQCTQQLKDVKSVSYSKLKDEFLIADKDRLYTWNYKWPNSMVNVYGDYETNKITYIRYHLEDIYFCSKDGLFKSNWKTGTLKKIHPVESEGIIVSPQETIFSVTPLGIIPINSDATFMPSIVGKGINNVTLFDYSCRWHNRLANFISGNTIGRICFYALQLIVITLIVLGVFLRKNGTFPSKR